MVSKASNGEVAAPKRTSAATNLVGMFAEGRWRTYIPTETDLVVVHSWWWCWHDGGSYMSSTWYVIDVEHLIPSASFPSM